ncbi:MAG TPA: hypothetical protein VN193_08095 [Candidatus Angelobacter sp.]|nr:hypothetical protein [Candidatus Angelobacter sp.]
MVGLLLTCGPVPAQAATPTVDAMVLNATVASVSPPVFLAVQGPSTYTLAGACSPTFPSYISTDDGLPHVCPGVTGSGTYVNVVCGTGTLSGTLTITELPGETSGLAYTGVLVAGLGLIEGSYSDDGGSGVAVGVALITPEPPTSCLTGVQQFQAQIVAVAAYLR